MPRIETDPRYRFDTFVVGAPNRLAVAAARAVAQSPGTAYNPLFIYSPSGLGKTHVLIATGQLAMNQLPGTRVRYTTIDEFVEELHAAVAAGRADALRGRYHEVDILLLDDVQFLAGRRETQAEILRLFDALQRSGRQVVLASDRPPSEISDLDQALLTRFSGGLIVDIDVPDYEMRVAILQMRCGERHLQLKTGVVEAVAQLGHGNVRELQGALARLSAFQNLGVGDVTPSSVARILNERRTPSAANLRAVTPSVGMAQGDRDEFSSFVSELASAVAQNVEPWRAAISEAATRWRNRGYRTGILDRAIASETPVDAAALLASYEGSIQRLDALERDMATVDPGLVGGEWFRDPERMEEAVELVERAFAVAEPPPAPSPQLTRSTFEIAPCNQFAAHAADAVVKEPGRRYNPLFIHGPRGVGKSHLAQALGNELAGGGTTRIACIETEAFTRELIDALQEGSVERWRARYRGSDVLILEDVQGLAGKEQTQDELFHLFNAHYSAGRQIILTADRAPKALGAVGDRLRSRFEGGLVVELQPPDAVLCEKLYAGALGARGCAVAGDVLPYLARRRAADVRVILATAERLAAAAQGKPLSLAVAQQVVEGAGAPAGAGSGAAATGPGAADAFFLDREKVIWDWPDGAGRLIEEMR